MTGYGRIISDVKRLNLNGGNVLFSDFHESDADRQSSLNGFGEPAYFWRVILWAEI